MLKLTKSQTRNILQEERSSIEGDETKGDEEEGAIGYRHYRE